MSDFEVPRLCIGDWVEIQGTRYMIQVLPDKPHLCLLTMADIIHYMNNPPIVYIEAKQKGESHELNNRTINTRDAARPLRLMG